MAEQEDALDLESNGATRESSNLSRGTTKRRAALPQIPQIGEGLPFTYYFICYSSSTTIFFLFGSALGIRITKMPLLSEALIFSLLTSSGRIIWRLNGPQ